MKTPSNASVLSAWIAGLGLLAFGCDVAPAATATATSRPQAGVVTFSMSRGFYDAPFELALSSETPGVTIRYTTDGSEPSANRGTVYANPIRIARTTPLRAAAFKAGLDPGPVKAQTYLFLSDILKQDGAGLPTAWGTDWQMDPRVVNDPRYASRIHDDMKSLPVLCVSVDPQAFWGPQGIYTQSGRHGVEAERACSAELFFPDHSRSGFEIYCGLRVAGGASRSRGFTAKHGLRLLFKTQYGASKLHYRFFDDTDVDEFDSIALRPNFNMSWVRTDNSGPLNNSNADGAERTHAIYVRDQFVKESLNAMGQIGAHERFVHLYINGMYWGLYNPSERTDASFAATYWGGKKEEYDAIFSDLSSVSRAVDGDKAAWNQMKSLAGKGLESAAAYAAIQRFLDVTNLADYMLLNFYASTVDWPWQNWNALRKREPGAQFRFVVWDAEYSIETPPWVPSDRTNVGKGGNETDSPARFYDLLRQNSEWRLLFADRAQRHLFNDGALTVPQTTARFTRLVDEIDRAIVGESARWGDASRKSKPYTRDLEWVAEKQRLLKNFFPTRTDVLLDQLRRANLYPRVATPVFGPHGGVFTNRLSLSVSTKTGEVFLTTDGSDPRQAGGAVASGAQRYSGPVPLSKTTRVQARVREGKDWSALVEALFVEANALSLRVTELMSMPAPPPAGSTNQARDFEFVEIMNLGTAPVDLAGVRISGGIRASLSNRVLAAGERVVLAADQTAFAARYGERAFVAGEYSGNLSAEGERLRLEGPLGEVIQEFRYPAMPTTERGRALIPEVPGTGSSWRPSGSIGGTPGG